MYRTRRKFVFPQVSRLYGASVEITKQNKAKIFLKENEYILPVPHDHVLSKDMVTELRHFLEKVGLTPDTLS